MLVAACTPARQAPRITAFACLTEFSHFHTTRRPQHPVWAACVPRGRTRAPHARTKRRRVGQALVRELREHPTQAMAAGRAVAAALLEGVLRAGEGGAGAAGADQAAFPYLIVRRSRPGAPHRPGQS